MIRACFLTVGFFLSAFVAPATIASPKELLPLVPDDYTFCLVTHRASAELSSSDSKFAQAFWDSPLIKELQSSNDAARLVGIKDQLAKELNTTEAELRELIFGGTFILTYRKPVEGSPDKESGLLILQTKNAKALRETVDRINQLQMRSGELKAIEEVKHKIPYFRRVKSAEGASPEFFRIDNDLLIFTPNETLLRETLDRYSTGAAESQAKLAYNSLGLDKSPVGLMVNPRSFDRDVADVVKAGKPSERTILDLFGKTWKAMDHLGVFVARKPNMTLGIAIAGDLAKLPTPIRSILAGFNRPLKSWNHVPETALFAMAMPFQPRDIDAFFKSVLPSEAHAQLVDTGLAAVRPLGEDLTWDEFLSSFGPEIAIWVSPPEAGSKAADPSIAMAIPLEAAKAAQASKMASDGLDFLIRFLSLTDRNFKASTIKNDGETIRTLTHSDLPFGVEPCFTIRNGTILLASHPRMFADYKKTVNHERSTETSNPLIRMSASSWVNYFRSSTPRIAAKLAGNPADQKKAEALLESLVPILSELDRVELNLTTEPKRATLRFQIIEKTTSSIK